MEKPEEQKIKVITSTKKYLSRSASVSVKFNTLLTV
jgi:hypothetical protein